MLFPFLERPEMPLSPVSDPVTFLGCDPLPVSGHPGKLLKPEAVTEVVASVLIPFQAFNHLWQLAPRGN